MYKLKKYNSINYNC